MSQTYDRALATAVEAALAAGSALRDEFFRDGGMRGSGGHADIDIAAERIIRDRIESVDAGWGILGEEIESKKGDGVHTWLVDPHDGTAAALRGYRGSAVSIGLVRRGVPVLGVVYAYVDPDDEGDLFSWAEGCPFTRNGVAVHRAPWPDRLRSTDTVIVSQAADRSEAGTEANAALCAPARHLPVASIAYRLARVAAGDGVACVSLAGPGAWDYCGGHALLGAVGGALVDERGRAVTYAADGASHTSHCFGGAPAVVEALAGRGWSSMLRRVRGAPVVLAPPAPQRAPTLARAQGCLLGQLAGDALGSLVEFRRSASIRDEYPDGVRRLVDGGCWNTIAGQPTDDSELALMLARSLAACGEYDAKDAFVRYQFWCRSHPFDIGGTTRQALSGGPPSTTSQANGALMRVSPLGIAGVHLDEDTLASNARADAALTHPHEVCQDANEVFAVTIARAIRGAQARALYEGALTLARGRAPTVLETLEAAADGPPEEFYDQMGWVRIALQNAFYQLLHAPNFEEGVVDTVMRGGDTDTNACIAGALLGAVYGRDAIPAQWRDRVTTCRPIQDFAGVHRPRQRPFWPMDALDLAARLVAKTQ